MCIKCEIALSKVTKEDRDKLREDITLVVEGWKKEFQTAYPDSSSFLMCCCLNMILWQGGELEPVENFVIEHLAVEASKTFLISKYSDREDHN
jgi:hypothetical protein